MMTRVSFILITISTIFLNVPVTNANQQEIGAVISWWNKTMFHYASGFPGSWLHCDFETGVHVHRADVIHTKLLRNVPFITAPEYRPDNKTDFYTGMIIDHDSTTEPVVNFRDLGFMILWLHINMRGLEPTSGETVIEYLQPISQPHAMKLQHRLHFPIAPFRKLHTEALEYATFFRILFDSGTFDEYRRRGHPCDIECERNHSNPEGYYYGRGTYIYKAARPLYDKRNKNFLNARVRPSDLDESGG